MLGEPLCNSPLSLSVHLSHGYLGPPLLQALLASQPSFPLTLGSSKPVLGPPLLHSFGFLGLSALNLS